MWYPKLNMEEIPNGAEWNFFSDTYGAVHIKQGNQECSTISLLCFSTN